MVGFGQRLVGIAAIEIGSSECPGATLIYPGNAGFRQGRRAKSRLVGASQEFQGHTVARLFSRIRAVDELTRDKISDGVESVVGEIRDASVIEPAGGANST